MIGYLLHLVQQVRREEHYAALIGDRANDGAEYVAVCLPAFSPDTVHRDEE